MLAQCEWLPSLLSELSESAAIDLQSKKEATRRMSRIVKLGFARKELHHNPHITVDSVSVKHVVIVLFDHFAF